MIETDLIKSYLEEFELYIRQNKSLRTVQMYSKSVLKFVDFIKITSPQAVTYELINIDFLSYLRQKPVSFLTIAMHLRHLRFFLEFLEEKNKPIFPSQLVMDRVLFEALKPKIKTYNKELLNEKEIEKIKKVWDKPIYSNNPRGIRNQLIIDLLANHGLRVSQLGQILRENYNSKDGTIMLGEKKGFRQLQLNPKLTVLVNRYLSVRKDDCQCMIVSFQNDPCIIKAWPLTTRSIQRIVRQTVLNAGIQKQISPSIFRNTLFNNLLTEGKTLSDISNLMGTSKNNRSIIQRFLNRNKKSSPLSSIDPM